MIFVYIVLYLFVSAFLVEFICDKETPIFVRWILLFTWPIFLPILLGTVLTDLIKDKIGLDKEEEKDGHKEG